MQITLQKPLDFIKQEGLLSFYLEYRNGVWVVVAGTFSQSLKRSEYEKVMATQNPSLAPEIENLDDEDDEDVDDVDDIDDSDLEEDEEEESIPAPKKTVKKIAKKAKR